MISAMNTKPLMSLCAVLALAGSVACTDESPDRGEEASDRRLSRAALEDKVRGGWAGQMIGVAYGAPTEFRHLGKIIEGEIEWTPEQVRAAQSADVSRERRGLNKPNHQACSINSLKQLAEYYPSRDWRS